jgi:hypothetical protein
MVIKNEGSKRKKLGLALAAVALACGSALILVGWFAGTGDSVESIERKQFLLGFDSALKNDGNWKSGSYALPAAVEMVRLKFEEWLKENKLDSGEGHSGQLADETYFYHFATNYIAGKKSGSVNVCETGFNIGHSALLFLSSNPRAKYYGWDWFFDDSDKEVKMASYNHLKTMFGDRIEVKWGDSTKTLAQSTELAGQCDLIVVDGGHDFPVALSDLKNFKPLANKRNHILSINDICDPTVSYCQGPVKAWTQLTTAKQIMEIGRKLSKDKMRGWAWGYYN